MTEVRKYIIPPKGGWIDLPIHNTILGVRRIGRRIIVLVHVHVGNPKAARRFDVFATGQEFEGAGQTYIGTPDGFPEVHVFVSPEIPF